MTTLNTNQMKSHDLTIIKSLIPFLNWDELVATGKIFL